jgi:hypothetical protein
MGNHQYDPEAFETSDWIEISQINNLVTLWQNKANRNIHIEEHKVYTLDSNELNH